MALVHVAAPVWSRQLTLGSESQYVGARLSTLGSRVPGVWLTNVNVTYAPARRPLSFGVHVTNLFDRQFGHPVGLEFRQDLMPQDGRAVSVRAVVRF